MAITHKAINTKFLQGYSVQELADYFKTTTATIESVIRRTLRHEVYVAPVQIMLETEQSKQLLIAEVYGEITV